jgi:WD40 repeat protein
MPPAIPDYELLRSIGRGAYGEVWLARSVTGVFRAAKIVYRSSFQEARPFEREFAGIQRFEPVSRSQENQISILHVGRNEKEGCFYYVMELADDIARNGAEPDSPPRIDPEKYIPKTLKEVISRRGRLTVAECLPVAVGLCRALGHLHHHGLIHRDVKPSNIIFVTGQPKLADIGLVSSLDATRSFVGTEGYVPREGPGTPAADLFSLGKVLYEAVTGRTRTDFPLLPENLAELPDRKALLELNEVILKACADSAQRYASAEDMRSELLLLQAGKSVKRLHAMERRLKRGLPLVAACVLLAGITITVQRVETARVRERARIESSYRKKAEEQQRKTRELLYAADMSLVQQAYSAGDFGKAEDLLKTQLPQAGEPDLRGFEWWYFSGAIRGEQECRLDGHSNPVRGVEFSPDGHTLLSAGYDGLLNLWDWHNGKLVNSMSNRFSIHSASFDHEGARIFFVDENGRFECRDIAKGAPLFWQDNACIQLAVNPVQDVVAVACDNSAAGTTGSNAATIKATLLLNARTGQEIDSLPDTGLVLKFSPDGTRLAIGNTMGWINVWDLRDRKIVARFNPMQPWFEASFSPDGEKLAVGDAVGNLFLWNIEDQKLVAQIQTGQINIWQVAFSVRGDLIATAGSDQTLRLWDAKTLQGLRTLRGHRGEVWSLAFSPDGTRIATGSKDQSVRVWNLAPRTIELPLSRTVAFWQWPVFSSDSRLVAVGDQAGVKVWHVQDGVQLCLLTNCAHPLGFSQDSEGLWVLGKGTLELHSVDGHSTYSSLLVSNLDLTLARSHAFFANRQLLALGLKDGQIALWDLVAKTQTRSWKSHTGNITALAFSPDGELLASTSERDWDANIWRVSTGELRHTFKGHKDDIYGAAFSPDGRILATASTDDTCRLWDMATFEPLAVLGSHRGGAYSVSFGLHGQTLAVGVGDHRVKLWNVPTFRELGTIDTEPVAVFSAGFSPDFRSLAAVSFDGGKGQCSLRLLRIATDPAVP